MEDIEEPIPSFFNNEPSDLLNEHRETYLMVNAISKRVRQLQLGDRALALPADGNRDPVYVAHAEFLSDKLTVTPRKVGLYRLDEEEEDDSPDLDALLGMDDEEVSFDASGDED